MSGGVESERDRELVSRHSGLGLAGWASWVNTGWLDDWVGVVGGVESPEAAGRQKKKIDTTTYLLFLSRLSIHTAFRVMIDVVDRLSAVGEAEVLQSSLLQIP